MANNDLYIASPLGFSEVGNLFMKEKLFPLLDELGYEKIDPWTLSDAGEIDAILGMEYGKEKKEKWQAMNKVIGKNNMDGIKRARGVIAVLDGVDVDSGTASEIGFAAALGRPIVGYRGDFRLSADNEGSIVNLQVEYFIGLSGGKIVTRFDDLRSALLEIFPQ